MSFAGKVVLLKHVLHLMTLQISLSTLKLNPMEVSGIMSKHFFFIIHSSAITLKLSRMTVLMQSPHQTLQCLGRLFVVEVDELSLDMKRMLTCGDQIHSEPFYCWGWSVPQASVDSDLLHKITLRVAHAAKVSDKGNLIFSVIILIILPRHPIMKLFQCLDI